MKTATLRPPASSGWFTAATGASRTASQAPAATTMATTHPTRVIVSAARYQSGLTGLMASLLRSEVTLADQNADSSSSMTESSMFSAIARSLASFGRTLRAKNVAAATLPS